MADFLISGGIFLAVVVIPFCGYKLYKKYVGKCGVPDGFFFCCRNRGGGREGHGSRLRNNFLRKRIVPKVELEFSRDLRVGDASTFKIIFPVCRHRTLEIVQHQPQSQPSLQESVYIEEHDLNLLSINIVKISGGGGRTYHPPVTPIRELLPRGLRDEDVVLVKFVVQESGFYEISIVYDGEHVPGSPFPVPFNPAKIDPEKTLCVREAPMLVTTAGDILPIYIKPRDRYGNECNFGDVNPALFHFRLRQAVDEKEGRMAEVETVIFNFTREVKQRNTLDLEDELFGLIDQNQQIFEVRMELEIFQYGVFQGIVSYDGTVIENGVFDVVALSPDEHRCLFDIMNNNPGARYHEAKLVSIWNETQKKSREIFIYVSSKTLIIKEFYFVGLIPIRIATFRILPATKIRILSYTSVESIATVCTIEISDRIQPTIVMQMDMTTGRLVLAMFAMFLKQRLGGAESFENKQKFFYEELKGAKDVPRAATQTMLNINRESLINSTLAETKSFSGKDWCRNFKIKFIGEEGQDDGGLRREWLNLLCKELFDNNPEGMFCAMGTSRLVHPNAARDHGKWTLKHYELAGKVVGKCLFETAVGGFYKQMVNARFTRSFLGQLIGYSSQYKYFEQDDPELYISKVKYVLENDVTDMDLTFSEDEYSVNGQLVKTADLVPYGRKTPVTNENKEEYLNLLAQYRLSTRVKREIECFLKGLNEIVPEGLLINFDENELEILMCGRSHFSVDDLKLHHVVTGEGILYDRVLPWFWTAVTNMTPEERGRLLQFTTGSSLLPHGGFKDLQPTFRITVYEDTFGKLPLAHTCFSEICLSMHRTYEEFEKALKLAINEGCEGFGRL